MSILINGMDMPKEGGKIIITADGSIWVNAWPTRGYMRVKNAKALPIPPHGRLIDADTCEDYFYEHLSDAGMVGAKNAIDEMPTIIPAEEGE